jgi:hypothetical protein
MQQPTNKGNTMKIGFKKGHKFYSPLVRAFTTSQWSHAAVKIGDRLYESTAIKGAYHKSGVRDYPITPEIIEQYEWFDCPVDDAIALQRYNEIKDCKYDYFSLLSFLFIKVRDAKRYYCYEQVLYMMLGGVDERATGEVLLTYLARMQRDKDARVTI